MFNSFHGFGHGELGFFRIWMNFSTGFWILPDYRVLVFQGQLLKKREVD
jgi:hypothetical protein